MTEESYSWHYMQKLQNDYQGVYIRDLWPTLEEVKKAEEENPDCIVAIGYGCLYLYPKFD